MLKLYSEKSAERVIRKQSPRIAAIAARHSIPAPIIKAVIYQELIQMDVLDPLADLAVWCNWLRIGLRNRLPWRVGKPGQILLQGRGLFGKLDSSTGYAQIFAFVGIDAVNFALDRGLCTCEELGLPADTRPDRENPGDLCAFWRRLKRETGFNLELAALNLLSAAEEMTGRIDYGGYTPDELKRIFTRYNGTSRTVTPYGEAVFANYQRYLREAGDMPPQPTKK